MHYSKNALFAMKYARTKYGTMPNYMQLTIDADII
jgi:hypothetical protein